MSASCTAAPAARKLNAVALLVMLSVSQDEAIGRATATDIPMLGATLLALLNWSVLIGTLVFAGLGCVTLNYVLYRARLVPRWLSEWGLVGGVLVLCYGLIGLFDGGTALNSAYTLLAMPLAVQEMVFAGWLIVKGFDQAEGSVDGRLQSPKALIGQTL